MSTPKTRPLEDLLNDRSYAQFTECAPQLKILRRIQRTDLQAEYEVLFIKPNLDSAANFPYAEVWGCEQDNETATRLH